MDLMFYVFLALILGMSLINIFRSVRAFVVSRKARIVKVMIGPAVIINSVFCVVFVLIAINRFSAAEGFRNKARTYEQILGIGSSVTGGSDGYQHVSASANEARAKVEQAIKTLNKNADIMDTLAWYSLAISIFDFTAGFGTLWYFTEMGLITSRFKFPEPITAVCKNGRIEIYFKARLANSRKLTSVKATPKNLAVYGRFIEWDIPEVQTVGQAAPPFPPDNNNMLT